MTFLKLSSKLNVVMPKVTLDQIPEVIKERGGGFNRNFDFNTSFEYFFKVLESPFAFMRSHLSGFAPRKLSTKNISLGLLKA